MLLVVGRIGRAHGIAGFVNVEPHTDAPETRFAPGASVRSTNASAGAPRTLQVAATRWHSGRLLVQFVGITDRNAAEALRGMELSAEVDVLEEGDDPEEYHDQALIGLRAMNAAGGAIGEVSGVLHLPAQDDLVVTIADGTQVLVPFVRQIVPTVDIPAGVVVIDAPPGLFPQDSPPDAAASEQSDRHAT